MYTPFGVQAPLDATGNPFRYTGRRYDPESGLYYYRARYYDAAHGRFLQTDPVGYADQMNLYTYVANDPLNMTDPSGAVICEGFDNCNEIVDRADEASKAANALASNLSELNVALASGDKLTDDQVALKGAFEKVFGEGAATSKNLRSAAKGFRKVGVRLSRNSRQKITPENSFSSFNKRGEAVAYYNSMTGDISLTSRYFKSDETQQAITLAHEAWHAEHKGAGHIPRGLWPNNGNSSWEYVGAARTYYRSIYRKQKQPGETFYDFISPDAGLMDCLYPGGCQ